MRARLCGAFCCHSDLVASRHVSAALSRVMTKAAGATIASRFFFLPGRRRLFLLPIRHAAGSSLGTNQVTRALRQFGNMDGHPKRIRPKARTVPDRPKARSKARRGEAQTDAQSPGQVIQPAAWQQAKITLKSLTFLASFWCEAKAARSCKIWLVVRWRPNDDFQIEQTLTRIGTTP